MGKPADGRGNTGSTDGIKAGGDAGNERHTCKANPATTDGIGKKHGTEDTSEDFSGERCALAPKAATKFPKASRCYVALGKARRVLWWLGLLLLSPALILWAEWGANGDDDTIICRVLTFSSSSCMNLTTATEYVRRLTLVLIMGVVCWIAALVIFGVRSYMRSVYPELRDHSSSASHVLVGIIIVSRAGHGLSRSCDNATFRSNDSIDVLPEAHCVEWLNHSTQCDHNHD